MRKLLLLLVLLCHAAPAQAQIIGIYLQDKAAKKFRDNMVPIGAKPALVGEIKAGISYDGKTISYAPNGAWELWLSNPDDPTALPYRMKGAEKVSAGAKNVARGMGADVVRMTVLDAHQTLAGLAEEYKLRVAAVDAAMKERDACAKGSPDWMAAHQRLMSQFERLRTWLGGTTFPGAAKKLDKDIERQKKVVAAAMRARVDAAKDMIALKPTPPELIEASKQITGGRVKFKVMESQHVRIVYMEELGDARIHALLEFAEDVIDGFRGDCVDPYVPEIEDKIPDRLFAEFYFGPEDIPQHERFWTDYYGNAWGDRKEERLEMAGTETSRPFAPERVHYWKYRDTSDLEGMVAHGLGHDLADLHYALSLRSGNGQAWIREAVGYYLSLEFLGRNSVSCKAWAPDPEYLRERRKEGKMADGMGLRDFYTSLALAEGPPIQRLALKILAEFEAPDIAKSWSFYEYLVRQEGLNGLLLMRAACETSRDKPTFIDKWRQKANALLGIEGRDVFAELDTRWRAHAESGGASGGGGRQR